MPANLQKETPAQVFSCEIGKSTFFQEHFFYRTPPVAGF